MKELNSLAVGMFQVNCHILVNTETKQFSLIDAPGEHPFIDDLLDQGFQCDHILLTHGHVDHVAGLKVLKSKLGSQIAVHEKDMFLYKRAGDNQFSQMLSAQTPPDPDFYISDNEVISTSGYNLTVIHTPGHTPGGVCFYSLENNWLFSGDTLFRSSIGRTDLPGGDTEQLLESIRNRLFTLPGNTQVYCGHGDSTTIQREMDTNPFL